MKWILMLTLYHAESTETKFYYDFSSKEQCERRAAAEIKKLSLVWPIQVKFKCTLSNMKTMAAIELGEN